MLRTGWKGGHVTPEWVLRGNFRLTRANLLKRERLRETSPSHCHTLRPANTTHHRSHSTLAQTSSIPAFDAGET